VAVRDEVDRSVITIRGEGLFAGGSATLAPEREGLMMRIADALAKQPGQVLVTGHTDNSPIRTMRFPSNWHLSEERAQSVQRILISGGVQADRVRVVLHPQSIVHSMVVCRDASVLAQLGTPDMRVPIAYALSFPRRIESGAARLDFTQLAALTFEAMDLQRFPGLQLAYDCLAAPEGSTTILNAANEVAVQAFLDRHIGFTAIHEVNCRTLQSVSPPASAPASVDDLLDLDRRARDAAHRHAKELA
jgi:hypothetical protein